MDIHEIKKSIKQIIADVANLDPDEIGDEARFIEDLQLDSLSLLEIGVDVDYRFKLGVPDERLKQLRTIQDAQELVQEVLAERARTDGGA